MCLVAKGRLQNRFVRRGVVAVVAGRLSRLGSGLVFSQREVGSNLANCQ